MSTIDEIQAVLPDLSSRELHSLERSIHQLYRQRNEDIICDDSYGAWTDEDQTSAAAEAFAAMDEQEGAGADAQT